jgi:hypothetical protein
MPTEEMRSRAEPQSPDVSAAAVLIAVGGFLGFVAVTMTGLFFYLRIEAPHALRQAAERPFPSPALQTNPQGDLKQFELAQRMALSGYGWVDRSTGIVRIPIEEAMRIVAARGDRAYDPVAPAAEPPADPAGVRP